MTRRLSAGQAGSRPWACVRLGPGDLLGIRGAIPGRLKTRRDAQHPGYINAHLPAVVFSLELAGENAMFERCAGRCREHRRPMRIEGIYSTGQTVELAQEQRSRNQYRAPRR